MIFLKRPVVAVAFAALIMSITVSLGGAATVSGLRPAASIPHSAVGLIAATGPEQGSGMAEKESPDDGSILSLIRPYLEQIRPYLAPIEAFLREQADAFRKFIMENLPSGERRGQPRAVIDLPPKSSPQPRQ